MSDVFLNGGARYKDEGSEATRNNFKIRNQKKNRAEM